MKNFYVIVFFVLSFVPNGFSQKSLSDYSYIVVSEQFEFQKDKDKYQLNSLTKFLFNKYGFNAYFESEVPKNLDRCDGLIADAEGTPGFIYTIVQVVIKDCYGAEVFRSRKGNSKVKDYKKAYYESMREAFISIEALDVKQKDINSSSLVTASDDDYALRNTKTSDDDIPVRTATHKQVVKNNKKFKNVPSAKYTSYRFSGTSFLLKKTSDGFNFYKEVVGADDDLLLLGKIVFLDSKMKFVDENGAMLVVFDDSKNLIIGNDSSKIEYKYEN